MRKYQKLFSVFVIASMALFALTAIAEENSEEDKMRKPVLDRPLKELKEERKEFREETKAVRKEYIEKMKAEREAFMEKLKTEREKFASEVRLRKEEFKTATKEIKSQWRGRAQLMVSQRFEVAIRNLERVQGRVAEAIEKLKAEGEDTSAVEEALNASKAKLEQAKTKLAEIKTLLPDTDEKVTPEVFEKIKLLARETKDLLKESHASLVLAIREIKSLKDDDNTEEEEDEDDETNQNENGDNDND